MREQSGLPVSGCFRNQICNHTARQPVTTLVRWWFFHNALLCVVPALLTAQQVRQPGQLATASDEPPLSTTQKFEERAVQSFGLRGFVGAAVSAGIGQGLDSPKEWGEGGEGFGRRFVSAFGGNFSRQAMAAGLEGALHEDPRYLPSTSKNFKDRALNVLQQGYLCKKDDGSTSFAYGRWISAFANAQFVNLWQPDSINSAGHGIERGFLTLGADLGIDFIREFVPAARSKAIGGKH